MDNTVPLWLNKPFLIQVLQSVEDTTETVEVLNFQCETAEPPGNNYSSNLYRVRVDYVTIHRKDMKSISLLIKTPLEHGEMREFLESANCYKKEVTVYKEILPKMYNLHNVTVTARSFTCPMENSLVLEDLKASGYVMADRLKQLDYNHCLNFFMTLAKLHALSVAAHNKHPGLIEDIGRHILYWDQGPKEEQEMFCSIYNNMMMSFANIVEGLEKCQHFADMIREKVNNSCWKKTTQLMKPGKGLNVLIHGDTWSNNIMFKYNNVGDIVGVRLVDFQLAQYSSFAFDIILFWWTSANEEVREHHKEKLFEVYRQTLNKTLNELKCTNLLSRKDMDLEMERCASFSLGVVAGTLPVAMADPDEVLNLNDLSMDEFLKSSSKNNSNSKYYKSVLPKLLQQVYEFGAFDEVNR